MISLPRLHRRDAAAADADDGGGLCVMYASVNGPPVTEHPSVGQSTSPSDRRAPTRPSWRPPTDAVAAAGRPSYGSTRPSPPGPAVDRKRSSGRARAPDRPTRRPPTRLMKQPSSHFQPLPVYSTRTPCRNTCHWQKLNCMLCSGIAASLWLANKHY